MYLSLVCSQMSSDETSEQSSVRDGAGYDKVFGLGDKSEGFSRSSERETSAQSPDGDVESYVEGNEKEVVDEDEGEEGSDRDEDEGDEGTSGGPRDNRPFILPEDWAVNKFLPMMSDRVLRSCVLVIKSQTISQFVSLGKTKGAIRGGSRTSASTMPCLL